MSDKILKLDQAQTLYQDLRGRIDALPTSEDIPTKVSDLTNDAGYLTSHQNISGKADKADTILDTTLSLGRLANSDVGENSVALGYDVTASGDYSFATGSETIASSDSAHAEGENTQATDSAAHAEGTYTQANGYASHAEGNSSVANGWFSHAEGSETAASGRSTHVFGERNFNTNKYPSEDNEQRGTMVEIVGNGQGNGYSNARALTWTGDEYLAGNLYVHANGTSTSGTRVATVTEIPEVPVQDVQVNGVSVLSNGVANVPIASTSNFGVAKIGSYQGVTLNANKELALETAADYHVKSGTTEKAAIVPLLQHQSTFYGLAKAAGHDEASSTEPLGTYTPEAKGAIQSMLGVSDLIAPEENNLVASKAYVVGDVFTANGKLYKATAAIAADAAIIPAVEGEEIAGANCTETNISENFIKNTDYATESSNGVVRIKDQYGIGTILSYNINTGVTEKYTGILSASSDKIKNGTELYNPIIPYRQHESVFYGLAKAAGDTTQKSSSNAIGIYTDSAKTAIKNMLGITQTLTVTVLTQDNVTVTGQTVTVRAVDSTGPIFATAAYEGQPVAFAVPSGFAYHVSVSDTLDNHFNPTTASGVITNTDVSVTLQYSDFSTIRTASDIKAALNANLDLTDLVGEQITCTKNGETLAWDVVDYDSTTGRIKLLLHDAFGTANMVFEPAQALMWCENGLAAGTYTFTWNTTQCYFTLTTAIPAGGQLRATNSQFQTYASQSATATLETGTVSTEKIAGATDLGHDGQDLLNHRDRVNYGSNNFAESALFGWLNSDAAANTLRTPVTKFSRAYSYTQPGFMNGLDADFVNCLDEVDWLCSTNNVYECPESLGGYTKGITQAYTVKAKFALASEMEIFGSYGGNPDGSTVFDLYNGADADDRKKYRGTSAQVWWLRSPSWSGAVDERYVRSSGSAYGSYAHHSYAVVPACQISRDSEVTE